MEKFAFLNMDKTKTGLLNDILTNGIKKSDNEVQTIRNPNARHLSSSKSPNITKPGSNSLSFNNTFTGLGTKSKVPKKHIP
jgi:hypothetical protein